MSICKNFGAVCRMIKIEHSIFALPFAYAGAFLAHDAVSQTAHLADSKTTGWPGFGLLFLLTVAMVGIRSFAMAFNRVADLPFDSKNPRTAGRPLVTGEITPWQTWRFCGAMAAVFVVACAAINPVCLALSPLALILAALYSYTKRFTWLCHFILGSVIGLAPIAGWVSVSPSFAMPPLLLGCAVLFWIAGFDVLYACQDTDFDREAGLHSLPARFGLPTALTLAAFCHINTVLFLFLTGLACGLSFGWYFFLIITACVLWWEHRLVSPSNLEHLRFAFALNGPISVLLLVGTLLGVYV